MRSFSVSSALVASSNRRMAGSFRIARAIAMRYRSGETGERAEVLEQHQTQQI
jgi:hypothetical protein